MTLRHDARRCTYLARYGVIGKEVPPFTIEGDMGVNPRWGYPPNHPAVDAKNVRATPASARPLLVVGESLRDRADSCMMMRADNRTET